MTLSFDHTVRLHDPEYRGFASDNYAGIHPEVLTAIAAANKGHQIAYGEDLDTARLQEVMAEHFGEGVEAFPVFNGTGANAAPAADAAALGCGDPHADRAHPHRRERRPRARCGAQSRLRFRRPTANSPPSSSTARHGAGATSTGLSRRGIDFADHRTRHRVYRRPGAGDRDHVHEHGMTLHMDGARIRTCSSPVKFYEFTTDAGVDVLSFGGTKNGLMFGEAVVVLNRAASEGLTYLRKLNMQLASKMRFVSAQLIAILTDDLYLRSAGHANAMATRLRKAVEGLPGLTITQKTQSNAVFAILPPGVADRLRESFRFYDWDPARGEVRWMCAFDTSEADIDTFAAALREELTTGGQFSTG